MEEKISHQPKNLLVLFYESDNTGGLTHPGDYLKSLIEEDNMGSRRQLLHSQTLQPLTPNQSSEPSLDQRLISRLGLTPSKSKNLPAPSLSSSSIIPAVDQAYDFVAGHYISGDQVIILSESIYRPEATLRAMELLAGYLTNGTLRASTLTRNSRSTSRRTKKRPIPVKGVVAGYRYDSLGDGLSITLLNDQLLARLPLSVEHVVSWLGNSVDPPSSLWTRRSSTGQIISEEFCIYTSRSELWLGGVLVHASNHLIHYNPKCIPNWDKRTPVWTHTYTTDSRYRLPQFGPEERQMILQVREESRPIGLHRHQLLFYHWTADEWDPEVDWSDSCLVWKSFCN